MDYPEFSGQDLNVSLQVEGRGRCDSRRCEGNLTTEADIGVMQPQTEECKQLPENGRGKKQVFP